MDPMAVVGYVLLALALSVVLVGAIRRGGHDLVLDDGQLRKAEEAVKPREVRPEGQPEVPACRVAQCKRPPLYPMVVVVQDRTIFGRLRKAYTIAFDFSRPNQLCADHKRKQEGILLVQIATMKEANARTEADNLKRALLSEEGALAIQKGLDSIASNQALASIDQFKLTDGKDS